MVQDPVKRGLKSPWSFAPEKVRGGGSSRYRGGVSLVYPGEFRWYRG